MLCVYYIIMYHVYCSVHVFNACMYYSYLLYICVLCYVYMPFGYFHVIVHVFRISRVFKVGLLCV